METTKTRWGSYTVLEKGPGFAVKRLNIEAGKCISLQSHKHRDEYWTVVDGTGWFRIQSGRLVEGDRNLAPTVTYTYYITPGDQQAIYMEDLHQVKAETDLTILEIWKGDILEEEDIKRVSYDWKD